MLVVGVRPGPVVFFHMQDEFGDRVDGDARCDLPCRVSTHAVSDEVKPGPVLDEERVLVMLPLPPDMSEAV